MGGYAVRRLTHHRRQAQPMLRHTAASLELAAVLFVRG
jgi:hypothetical protein